MTVKIIVRPKDVSKGSISPFAEAIQCIKDTDTPIKITSPYLTSNVIISLIEIPEARLLIDLEQTLKSSHDRKGILETIRKFSSQIRSYDFLHAKVILSDTAALVGSANITIRGLSENEEAGVFLQNEKEVSVLHDWFEDIWQKAKRIDKKYLQEAENFCNRIASFEKKNKPPEPLA